MSETAADQAAMRWQQPEIGGEGEGLVTASRLERLQREAYEEAWRQGHAEGLAAGEAELSRRVETLERLIDALARPLEELDDEVESQILSLIDLCVRKLIRRELQADPGHVIGVVRDALRMLPVASRAIQVHLHPDDASLVQEALAGTEGERAWSITEDPLVSRGGCIVTSEKSEIDARVESRLNRLLGALIEDERS